MNEDYTTAGLGKYNFEWFLWFIVDALYVASLNLSAVPPHLKPHMKLKKLTLAIGRFLFFYSVNF